MIEESVLINASRIRSGSPSRTSRAGTTGAVRPARYRRRAAKWRRASGSGSVCGRSSCRRHHAGDRRDRAVRAVVWSGSKFGIASRHEFLFQQPETACSSPAARSSSDCRWSWAAADSRNERSGGLRSGCSGSLKRPASRALSSRHDPLSLRLPRSDGLEPAHMDAAADRYMHQGSRRRSEERFKLPVLARQQRCQFGPPAPSLISRARPKTVTASALR